MKMLTVKKAPQSSREQHGFTMVELMVALGLSAGLLFGVLQIFDANSRSSRLQNAMGEVQEGGRIAIEMITPRPSPQFAQSTVMTRHASPWTRHSCQRTIAPQRRTDLT